jgi:hypothetical protein
LEIQVLLEILGLMVLLVQQVLSELPVQQGRQVPPVQLEIRELLVQPEIQDLRVQQVTQVPLVQLEILEPQVQ